MLRIETGLVLLSLLMAFLYPRFGSSWFERFEDWFSCLAQRRGLSVAVIGITALLLRAALLPLEPIPEPVVHDEFGYLLAADTFAHGRLTNPTPQMWEHFESFSILVKPTYQCYAQPAQGMFLAFGKVVFGHPFWGVWLSAGLMCASITWMLQGWLPPEWAFLGGALAILRYGVLSYWANSYWGGAAGAIGGALVIGALPRIKESQRVWHTLLMGLGLATLANSRPYEGFIFSLSVGVMLFAWMWGETRPPFRVTSMRIILPLALTFSLTLGSTGYYLWRVTGNPFRLPYQIERETYSYVPALLWQKERQAAAPHVYRSEAMRQLYADGEIKLYRISHTPVGFVFVQAKKVVRFWTFFLGPVLTLPLLMLAFTLPYGFSWRDVSQPMRSLLKVLAVTCIGIAGSLYFDPHYASPLAAVTLAIVLRAMQILRNQLQLKPQASVFLTRSTIVICLIMFGVRLLAAARNFPLISNNTPAWHEQGPPSFGRAKIAAELSKMSGGQLVIVRYGKDHNPFEEWVYNEADIDDAHIVWAREVAPAADEELTHYFSSRRIWLLEADHKPPQLSPYNLPTPPNGISGDSR